MICLNRDLECKVTGCATPVHAKGYCQKHYTQIWRMSIANRNIKCSVDGCDNPVHAKGYCRKHYTQVWRKGEISKEPSWGTARHRLSEGDAHERLRVLERELKKIEEMYNNVVGFESRLRWRREIAAVEVEIGRIQADAPNASEVYAS